MKDQQLFLLLLQFSFPLRYIYVSHVSEIMEIIENRPLLSTQVFVGDNAESEDHSAILVATNIFEQFGPDLENGTCFLLKVNIAFIIFVLCWKN